ncbi:MAG: NifU family protein [Candidatus Sumerlaeota bacterium]|nr:NifU family protein [Candidatus Sumerlaeota bacterium]
MAKDKIARHRKPQQDLPEQIRRFIEEQLRPAIREDGGDIAFEALDGDMVRITMGAACCGCPAASRTSKFYVEKKIQEKFSADLRVQVRFVKPYYAV